MNGVYNQVVPKAIIFDCDGILVDSEPVYSMAFHQTLQTRGLGLAIDYLRQKLHGQSIWDCYNWLAKNHDFHVDEQFHAELLATTDRLLIEEIRPVPGIVTLLDQLQCPRAVASNGIRPSVESNLKRCGFTAYFGEKVFTVEQAKKPKPAPDIYLLAAKSLGLMPEECLVIEDSFLGVQAAVAAGSFVYWLSESTEAFEFDKTVFRAAYIDSIHAELRERHPHLFV